MYLPGQIIYDLDKKEPIKFGDDIWDTDSYPKRSTHFIQNAGNFIKEGEIYKLATPSSVEEAKKLLEMNVIVPAAISPSHCIKCRNWKNNKFSCDHYFHDK